MGQAIASGCELRHASAGPPAWQQAARVEPTNPTWLLLRAQGLLVRAAAGVREAAGKMLAAITSGKWQDRFFNDVNDASRLAPVAKDGR